MTTLQYLPSPQNYNEYFQISLEQQQFTVYYNYNSRDDLWYLSLEKDAVFVVEALRLNQGFNIGYNYVDFPLTQGVLYVFSPSGSDDSATLETFGKSIFLVYEPNDDQ
jgi:hypothetical protein